MEALILGVLFAAFWFFSKKYPEKAKERQVTEAPRPKKEGWELDCIQKLVKQLEQDKVPLWRIYLRLRQEFDAVKSGPDSLEVMAYIFNIQQQIEDVIVSRNEKSIELLEEDEPDSDEQVRLLLEMNVQDECDTSETYRILLSFYDEDEENYRRIYFQAKKCLTKPESNKWFQKAQKRVEDLAAG